MKRLARIQKMRLFEIILCLIMCALLLAMIIFTFTYNPGITNVDVKYGLRYGFVDYFKGSPWKRVAGISAVIIVLLFCAYWFMQTFKRKIQTLGPIYLILLLVDLVFANGYYNVVNRLDGMMALILLMVAVLLINCVYSFWCYIQYLESKDIKE